MRRLWRVPLLIAGLILFGGWGFARVDEVAASGWRFEEQVKGVHSTLEKGEFAKAIEQINMLGDYYKEQWQRCQLQGLAADAFYYASKKEGGGVAENWKHVTEHYEKAMALGARPTAVMDERWGEAALGGWGM